MIANYSFRVRSNRVNAPLHKLGEAAHDERFTLAFLGFGFATALWAATFSLQPGLLPLTAVPVLLTARYRDRRLAAIAILATAFSASLFARLPNLEIGVWHAVLFAVALAGLYLLAEKNVVRAPKSDRISRFLAESREADRQGAELVLECEGLGGIASVYGAGAREHVLDLLRRSIRQQANGCSATQESPTEFRVFLPAASTSKALETATKIRSAFEQSTFDAGYGTSVNLTSK